MSFCEESLPVPRTRVPRTRQCLHFSTELSALIILATMSINSNPQQNIVHYALPLKQQFHYALKQPNNDSTQMEL